jgi:tRNA threonylcarbamoyl adenosine modification protein YeaZ
MPIGLAIHTSSPDLGLAIGEPDEMRYEVWDLGRDMTTYLHEKLAQFMSPQSFQELAFIAVAQGPGSFTGTRMGMTVARTLAQQLSIPLFGISSLRALAYQDYQDIDQDLQDSQDLQDLDLQDLDGLDLQGGAAIAVWLAAQRGELHVGIYENLGDWGGRDWDKNCDRVLLAQTWQEELQAIEPGKLPIVREAPVHQGKCVRAVLEIAHQAYAHQVRPLWWQVTPTYGQHPVTP